VASPNPESDKNHDSSAVKAERAATKQYSRARKTTGLGDDPRLLAYIETATDQRRAKEESYWNRQVLWQCVTACATIAAFGAAAYYACYAKKQAKATVVAAKAAKESADAEVSANRAWIVPSGNKTWMVNNNFMGFEFDWINAGKTPAVHVRATEEFKTDPNAKFKQGCVTYDPKKGGEEQITPVVLPQQTFPIAPGIPGEAFAWSEGKSTIIQVHGCIRYVDVLTNSERYTDFCISVRRRGTVGDVFPCSSIDFGISPFDRDSQKWEPIVFQ
jgi:hypothetical protein